MRKLSTNALLVFSGDVSARILGFFATIYLARVLEADYFGIITIGMSILAYATWFADMGLITLGTREMAKPPAQRDIQFGDIIFLKFGLAFIVFIVFQSIISFFYSDAILLRIVKLYLLCIFSDALLTEWYFRGTRNYKPYTFSRILSGGIYLILLYLFVQKMEQVERVPVFLFIGNLSGTVLLLLFKQKGERLFPSRPSLKKYINNVKKSAAMGLGSVFAQVVFFFPPIALGFLYSTTAAGIFAAGLKILMLALMVDRVFIALFFPAITNLWTTRKEELGGRISQVLRIVIVSGFSISLVVSIFSGQILHLIFGKPYDTGAVDLSILSWFLVVTLINSTFSLSLIAIGKEKSYFMSNFKSGVLSIIIIFVLTYWLGSLGTSLAIIISEVIIVTFMYQEFKKYITARFVKPILLSIAASLLLIASLPLVGPAQLWQIPVYWISFVILIFLFKGIGKEDLVWMLRK